MAWLEIIEQEAVNCMSYSSNAYTAFLITEFNKSKLLSINNDNLLFFISAFFYCLASPDDLL